MSINSIASSMYVAPSPLTQGVQSSTSVNGTSDQDGDGDGGGAPKAHRHHGGGQMQNALMQALQSLGLSLPQSAGGTSATSASTATNATGAVTATSGTSSTAGAVDSDGDSDGSTSGTGNVKKDIGQFMHALFQAIKNESTAATSTTGTTSADPKANFAAGLSALISQVSNGSAPSGLQSAFSQLQGDLTQTGSTSSSASGSTSSSSSTTLQALLTQLQQNLGYGASSSSAALGNLLTAQA